MVNRLKKKGGDTREKSSGFVYKKRSPDAIKKRAEQKGGRFDSPFKQGVDTFRPKDGDNLIRFLPPTWPDHEHYGYDIWVHRYIGADNSTYLCRNKMLGKPCAICVAAKEANDAGEKDDAKALGAAKLTCAWIIDRDDDGQNPQLYPMSWTMDRDIAALCSNKRTGATLLIDHPDEGYDVTIKRSGQGIKTRYYGLAVDRESSPIDEDQKVQDRILEYITDNPIPSVLHYYENDYLEKVLTGAIEEKDDEIEDDDDDKPKKRRARDEEDEEEDRKPRRRVKDEDEEEDEEDEKPRSRRRARDEEEEEEEKPRGKNRRVSSDDEEEEKPRSRRRAAAEEEEDEEDEKPRSRRRARDEEEEEEEDEDDDDKPKKRRARDEEEEEEEKPRSRRRAVEEEEEEEEEDERPRGRRK